jgi:hypothetical protein
MLRKATPFLPAAGQLQSCLCEYAEWTGEHHAPCTIPIPTPKEHNPAQSLGRLNPTPPPSKTDCNTYKTPL